MSTTSIPVHWSALWHSLWVRSRNYPLPLPPLVLTRARFSFRGQKGGNTGSPCLDKPVLPCTKCHRTHVAGIGEPYPSNLLGTYVLATA